jgi:antitoxin (DNA-binding transcriptional repressor) of toxin-antitoxin stability system
MGTDYPQSMTAAHSHAFEVPPDNAAPADAVAAAEGGEVVYLTRSGAPVAAIVPPDVAAAGMAAVIALADAADVRAARAARAEGGAPISHDEMLAQYADTLAAYPDPA